MARRLPMKTRLNWRTAWAAAALGAVVTLIAAGCGGSGEPAPSTSEPDAAGGIIALSVTDDISVGPERFAFVLLDADNLSIGDATIHVRFYRATAAGAELAFEADAVRHDMVDWFPHLHGDGSTHIHMDSSTYYAVPAAQFDRPGRWRTEFTVSRGGADSVTVPGADFEVRETSSTPSLGEPVPPVDFPTVDDVADIADIDTSDPPRPELHAMSIADALEAGRPFVVTFSSPAFCQSRLCGPVTDVVASLEPTYGDRVNFIHVEPYDLAILRGEGQFQLVEAGQKWGLPSEPWTFVVDASGRLAAKFGGVLSPEELEAALTPLLGS